MRKPTKKTPEHAYITIQKKTTGTINQFMSNKENNKQKLIEYQY